jgi:glucokinase
MHCHESGVVRTQALNQLLIHGDFYLKLQEFKLRMMMQVINILSPFLAFALAYNQAKVHNMLATMLELTMLELHFKNMKVIRDFVGQAHAIQIVTNYESINIVCLTILIFSFEPC